MNTGVPTMTNTKTLMLVAVTAVTLGVGTAMAQSLVPSGAAGDYLAGQRQATLRTAPNPWIRLQDPIQAGASDIDHAHDMVGHTLPFDGGYSRNNPR
jgi:hypothetical protein